MCRLLSAALLLVLGGCSLLQVPAPNPGLRPLAPLLPGESRQLMQHIAVHYRGEQKDLIGASLLGPQQLKVSLLTPEGVSLVDILYDGEQLQAHQYLGGKRQIPPQALLADIQLVYWPLPLLRQSLPAGWQLDEEVIAGGRERRLYCDGALYTRVTYSGGDIWRAQVQLEQKTLGYALSIKNL